MKVASIETFVVNVPYVHDEVSSRIRRSGVTAVVVKLRADNGLIGWGEACGNIANAISVDEAVRYAKPFVVGASPWERGQIAFDYYKRGTWDRRMHTANFAYAGIDMALWDLCGKAAGEPVYRLLGGARRDEVDYFYYLARGSAESLEKQCREGVARGYGVFYLKTGVDTEAETQMLEAVRATIGPERAIRIDCNEAWTINQAIRTLNDWDRRFRIDFCEAPVAHELPESMCEVRSRVPCAIAANEALGREVDVLRIIRSRCADVLCFSPFLVGTLARFMTMSHVAHLEGLLVCKHTHGELGIAAAACQHAMLCVPNAVKGNQQTESVMAGDILKSPLAIRTGPIWGRIDAPGLGVEIDDEKLAAAAEAFRRDGQFVPYQDYVDGICPRSIEP